MAIDERLCGVKKALEFPVHPDSGTTGRRKPKQTQLEGSPGTSISSVWRVGAFSTACGMNDMRRRLLKPSVPLPFSYRPSEHIRPKSNISHDRARWHQTSDMEDNHTDYNHKFVSFGIPHRRSQQVTKMITVAGRKQAYQNSSRAMSRVGRLPPICGISSTV